MKNTLPPNSRYAEPIEVTQARLPDGRTVAYLRRRFIPPPSTFALLSEHVVADGERIDHIANQYLGDPEMYWLICDANRSFDPAELTSRAGRRLRITLPAGLPGPVES